MTKKSCGRAAAPFFFVVGHDEAGEPHCLVLRRCACCRTVFLERTTATLLFHGTAPVCPRCLSEVEAAYGEERLGDLLAEGDLAGYDAAIRQTFALLNAPAGGCA